MDSITARRTGWAAALVRTPGAATADLYMDPTRSRPAALPDRPDLRRRLDRRDLGQRGHGRPEPPDAAPQRLGGLAAAGRPGLDRPRAPASGRTASRTPTWRYPTFRRTATSHRPLLSARPAAELGLRLNPGLNANARADPRNPADPTRADLYFSPDADLNGQALTLTVAYANGKTDRPRSPPARPTRACAMPAPTPVAVSLERVHGDAGSDRTART